MLPRCRVLLYICSSGSFARDRTDLFEGQTAETRSGATGIRPGRAEGVTKRRPSGQTPESGEAGGHGRARISPEEGPKKAPRDPARPEKALNLKKTLDD